jgi:hypothetical protein
MHTSTCCSGDILSISDHLANIDFFLRRKPLKKEIKEFREDLEAFAATSSI